MDSDGSIEVGGERLTPQEVEFRPVRRAGIALASDGEWATALDLVITPELLAEGAARDLIRQAWIEDPAGSVLARGPAGWSATDGQEPDAYFMARLTCREHAVHSIPRKCGWDAMGYPVDIEDRLPAATARVRVSLTVSGLGSRM